LEKVPLFEELEQRVKRVIMNSHGKSRNEIRKEIDAEVAGVIDRILNKSMPIMNKPEPG